MESRVNQRSQETHLVTCEFTQLTSQAAYVQNHIFFEVKRALLKGNRKKSKEKTCERKLTPDMDTGFVEFRGYSKMEKKSFQRPRLIG